MSDINKILDNGWAIVIYKNGLGSYTSFSVANNHEQITAAADDAEGEAMLTDDFTPEKSLNRLADKVLRVGDYAPDGKLGGCP